MSLVHNGGVPQGFTSGHCICCSLKCQEQSSVKTYSDVEIKRSSNEPSLVCLSCKQCHHFSCVQLFIHRMSTTLSKSALENDVWYTCVSKIGFENASFHVGIEKGICCDFLPSFTKSTIPKPKPPRQDTDALCSSFNDILLNTDARSSEDDDDS